MSVSDLENQLITRIKQRTARQGYSAEAAPSFDDLAAEFRAMTQGRPNTPAEMLLREGRDER